MFYLQIMTTTIRRPITISYGGVLFVPVNMILIWFLTVQYCYIVSYVWLGFVPYKPKKVACLKEIV